MKFKTVYTFILVILTSTLFAGGESAWMTDHPKAMEKAKSEKKWLLMDFEGSDWCPLCMELKKRVFDTKEFKEYAVKNLVLLEVDFPGPMIRQSPELIKQNKELDVQYKVEGALPTVVILGSDGKEIGRFGGEEGAEKLGQIVESGPAAFIAELEKLKKKS